jgi:hypothetical protein
MQKMRVHDGPPLCVDELMCWLPHVESVCFIQPLHISNLHLWRHCGHHQLIRPFKREKCLLNTLASLYRTNRDEIHRAAIACQYSIDFGFPHYVRLHD